MQGKLTASTGTALMGNQTVTFRLYDVAAAPISSAVWVDTMTVTLSTGMFNVALGTHTFLDALAFDKTYYLGLQVSGDASEMTPRQALGAAPYAQAQNQFDAMVSLAYNIGSTGFERSSVAMYARHGQSFFAASAFLKYNRARVNGQLTVSPGLTNRRVAEADLFMFGY